MPKIIEATCTVKRVVQVVQYEPEEAFVAIKLSFADGEEMDASDLDTALDQARAAVYKRLGIADDSEATVVEDRVEHVTDDQGRHDAAAVSRDPVTGTGRRRGANPTPTTTQFPAASVDAPKSAEEDATTAVSVNSGRRRGANPIQTTVETPSSSNAAPATSGSRRRGSDTGQQTAATSAPAASKPPTDLKQSDVSKAMSELGRAKGNLAAFQLLERYGVDRADQVPKDKWPQFVDEAIKLATA